MGAHIPTQRQAMGTFVRPRFDYAVPGLEWAQVNGTIGASSSNITLRNTLAAAQTVAVYAFLPYSSGSPALAAWQVQPSLPGILQTQVIPPWPLYSPNAPTGLKPGLNVNPPTMPSFAAPIVADGSTWVQNPGYPIALLAPNFELDIWPVTNLGAPAINVTLCAYFLYGVY